MWRRRKRIYAARNRVHCLGNTLDRPTSTASTWAGASSKGPVFCQLIFAQWWTTSAVVSKFPLGARRERCISVCWHRWCSSWYPGGYNEIGSDSTTRNEAVWANRRSTRRSECENHERRYERAMKNQNGEPRTLCVGLARKLLLCKDLNHIKLNHRWQDPFANGVSSMSKQKV